MVEKPDHIEQHSATVCKDCGASLEAVKPDNVERRQIHDIPPMMIIVTKHQVDYSTCPHYGMCIHGEFPADVKYPVQYGVHLKALMV